MRLNKSKLKWLTTLLLAVNFFAGFCQKQTGSLYGEWKNASVKKNYLFDTASVILLNKLSYQYLYNNTDSALYFAKQSLVLAKLQKYLKGEAISNNSISSAYYVKGDYMLSLDASESLLDISRKINYATGIAKACKNIGLIYLDQEKFGKAIADFKIALNLCTQLKDSTEMNKVYFDIGLAFDEMRHPENAFYYLDKSMEIAKKKRDTVMLSMTLNRTGETYFALKKYKLALKYYNTVVNAKNTDNWEQDFAYSGIAQTYEMTGQYDKAILNARKSLAICNKVNSRYDAVRALSILTKGYAAINDYRNAYLYETQLKKTNDSLFNIGKDKEINYLHLKQQEAENKQLQNDIKSKEQIIYANNRLIIFRNLLAFSAVLAALIIFWSYCRSTALNKVLQQQNTDIALQKEEITKQKEALDELNRSKDQLFSIISHDLRSPFSAILQTMDMMREGDLTAEEQKKLFEGFYRQVSLVNLMVNNLLAWSNSQQTGIKSNPVKLNIKEVMDEIISLTNYLATIKNINLYQQADGDKWVYADINHVKIIFQNLIGNAVKFTREGGTINIYYTEDGAYQVIHVKDNGIGIAPEKMDKLFKVTGREISGYGTKNEAGAGIGLALIKQFIDVNGGKIEITSLPGKGTDFAVYFKKDLTGV